MDITTHHHSLEGFLALFGDTFFKHGKRTGLSWFWTPIDMDPPYKHNRAREPLQLTDFDEKVHKDILACWRKAGTSAMVMFEDLELGPDKRSYGKALPVGPDWSYKAVEHVQGQRIGDVPSRFQWPTACVAKHRYDECWEAVLVPYDAKPFVIYLPKEDVLKHVQDCVGGPLEYLSMPDRDDVRVLINKERKSQKLPKNAMASQLCQDSWETRLPEGYITGHALLVGKGKNYAAEMVDVPLDLIISVTATRYGIQDSPSYNPYDIGINEGDLLAKGDNTGTFKWRRHLGLAAKPGKTLSQRVGDAPRPFPRTMSFFSLRRAIHFCRANADIDFAAAAICKIHEREDGKVLRKAGILVPVSLVL